MQLQGITRIIQTFKPAECDFIRDYYLRKANGSSTKRLQLFDLLRNKLFDDNEKVCRLLYNRKPDSGFSQLKKRLKQDLLDFMVFFPSTKNELPDNHNAELACRKLFLQAKVLVQHGIHDEAIGLLKKLRKMANDHELNQLKAMSLDLLQEISDQSFKDFKADSAKVETDLEIHLTKVRARNLYKKLEEKGISDFHGEDEELMARVKAMCEEYLTPGLSYWHHLLSLKKNTLEDQAAKAYWHGLRLYDMLDVLGATLSNDQVFDFYYEMALLLVKARKFHKAELFARKAELLCDKTHVNVLKVLELRFVLAYSTQQYDACLSLWQQAMHHPTLENDDQIYFKWIFFEACLQFSNEDFKQCQVLLGKSADVCRDKSGYFTEHRLLEILNLIELEDYDLLEYKIESFRKLIEYHNDKCPEHLQGIVRFFRTLVKSDYDLQTTYLQHHVSLKKIIEEGRNYQLISLIDVIGWIEAKVNSAEFRMVG